MGGRSTKGIHKEIYVIDLNKEEKEWVFIGNLPIELCSHSSCLVDDEIYLYGGTNG